MSATRTITVALALCFALASVESAFAHDLHGIAAERNSLDPETRAKLDEISELRRLLAERAKTTQDRGLEAVVQRTLRWPTNLVTVCFFDGKQSSRNHVATVAIDWSKGDALQFDFGPVGNRKTCDPQNPSDIRVSFVGAGYWSYVGTQARHISPYKQTLNLAGLDKGSGYSDSENGVILHEFGHAIGFEHEHQSPAAGCEEEFNWPYLYVAMGWSKAEVDRNMRRLNMPSNKTGLLTTPFDPQSVMLYALDPAAFKNPATAKCYIPIANNAPSPTDRAAAQAVYPTAPVAVADQPPAGSPLARNGVAPQGAAAAMEVAQRLRRLQELTNPPSTR